MWYQPPDKATFRMPVTSYGKEPLDGPATTEGGRIVTSNQPRPGTATHASLRPTTTKAYAEDVVNWLHDASLRLLEARIAREAAARRLHRRAA